MSPQEANPDKRPLSGGRIVAVVVILVLAACIGAALGVAARNPGIVAQILHSGDSDAAITQDAGAPAGEAAEGIAEGEGEVSDVVEEGIPTKRIASYGDIAIYSPIVQSQLTGVLFHQASYATGLPMTTELPEANIEWLSVDNPVRVNNEQTEGEWADADALHLYRTIDTTAMDTSIDVGAPWGTVVHSPVTGTVVLVEDYLLYGEVPDVKIHIQPEGHPELDVVLLHQYDPMVKPGDKVEGGVTPISFVRDIAKDLTDVQLGFYTRPEDPGNHSHVQVNDANYPGYREETLKNAYQVP